MNKILPEEWTKSLNEDVVVHYTQRVWDKPRTEKEIEDFLANKGGKKEYVKVVFKSRERAIEFVCQREFLPNAENFHINGFRVHWNKKQQRFWFGFL